MRDITYLNLDLSLERADEGYRTRVLSSPAGQASGGFLLPFSQEELEAFVAALGDVQAPDQGLAEMRRFGEALFRAVFPEDVEGIFRRSLDRAQHQESGLRIRLHLTQAPELTAVPWEVLYDPGSQRFLALTYETPIVRYLELPVAEEPLAVTPPLHVLAIVSDPSDLPRLDTHQERLRISQALAELAEQGLVAVDWVEKATLAELQRKLRRNRYHIAHFIGHGVFDEERQEGMLAFEDEQGRSHLVSARTLAILLRDHRTLRLAVLNACEGARAAAHDPFSGAAQRLVQQDIPAAMAMQVQIPDLAAVTFARELYAALADACPVDAALTEARKAIYFAGFQRAWAIPVLYTHAPDGRIFRPPASSNPGEVASMAPGSAGGASGGVHIDIAGGGGVIRDSSIRIGDVAGGHIQKGGEGGEADDQEADPSGRSGASADLPGEDASQ